MARFMDWFRGEDSPDREPEIRPEDGEVEMLEFRDIGDGRRLISLRPNDDDSVGTVDNDLESVPEELHLRDAQDILDDVLRLEDQCRDPEFVRWLIRHKTFEVDRTDGHRFSYYGEDVDGNVIWNVYRTFNVGEMSDGDWSLARREIREYYDDWAQHERRKVMIRAGLITGIGLGIIALATGLGLGLKRAGNDIQNGNKPGPGPGPKPGTPWTEIENTARKIGGGILVWIGDHPFLVIGGVVLYIRSRRN